MGPLGADQWWKEFFLGPNSHCVVGVAFFLRYEGQKEGIFDFQIHFSMSKTNQIFTKKIIEEHKNGR